MLTTISKNIGGATYLLIYKEAYILETAEIDGAHELPKYTNILIT